MGKGKNMLLPENCNKAMCKSCIFRTDGKEVVLRPGRLDEIKSYILSTHSHTCHSTNKTCYGGLTYQAQMLHRMGTIEEPTVECFLETVRQILNL